MTIWVDADSCPVRVREIICKAGKRLKCKVVFAANRLIPLPKSNFVFFVLTGTESQAADKYITAHAVSGDLVITRDIPLAKILVDCDIAVINDRGDIFSRENISERMSIRNFMYDLYESGLYPERSKTFGQKEVQKFSNTFDSILTFLIKKASGITFKH